MLGVARWASPWHGGVLSCSREYLLPSLVLAQQAFIQQPPKYSTCLHKLWPVLSLVGSGAATTKVSSHTGPKGHGDLRSQQPSAEEPACTLNQNNAQVYGLAVAKQFQHNPQ
jgi:hypothetical protein